MSAVSPCLFLCVCPGVAASAGAAIARIPWAGFRIEAARHYFLTIPQAKSP